MMFRRTLRHLLLAIFILPMLFVLWLAPLRLATAWGRLMGRVFCCLAPEAKTTLQTLAHAFPDWSKAERLRCMRASYRNQLGHMFQLFALNCLSKRAFLRQVELENIEVVQAELDKGKNVIVCSGHFGSWEWLCPALAHHGHQVAVYTGALKNRFFDRIVNHYRSKHLTNAVDKKQGMRGLIKTLQQKNQVLCLLVDQHYSRKSHWVYFFGQLSSIAPGASLLAQRTNTSLVFAKSLLQPNGRYRCSFELLPNAPTNLSRAERVLHDAQAFHQALETNVRRSPENYLWQHKRWRLPLLAEDFSEENRQFLAQVAKHGYPSPPSLANTPNPVRPKPAFNPSLPPVFLDRDGVLIEDVHYLSDLKALKLLKGVAQAVKQLNQRGHAVVVVSNQSAVARGMVNEEFVVRSMQALQTQLRKAGARLDAVYYCPHHPAGQGIYRRQHPERKPAAGMLLRASREYGLNLQGAWLVGDQPSDLACGAEHGVIPLLVRTGKGAHTAQHLPADFNARGGRVFADLPAAAAWLLSQGARAKEN